MSVQTYELIEQLLIKTSMKRFSRIHWGRIYAHCREYVGTKEKQEIKKLADRWGVELIGQ